MISRKGDKAAAASEDSRRAFPREFIFEVSGGTYHLKETVAGDKTIVPPACSFSA